MSRWQMKGKVCVLAVFAGAFSLPAQMMTPNPVLHRRALNHEEEVDIGTRSTGRTRLPLDASGEYALGGDGRIDVELQTDRLSGYITRLGDRESDQGTPLTFFFAISRLSGDQLAFTTRQIHGVWFSFEGTIVRGNARGRDQEGYYLLQGRLTLHDASSQTQQPRMVSLPLARPFPAG